MYPNIFKLSNLDISELEKDELIKSITQYDIDILESICLEFNMFDFKDETDVTINDLDKFSNFILEKYRYTNFKNLLKISDFLFLDTIFHVHLKLIYYKYTNKYITNIYNIYNYNISYVKCLYDIIHKGIKLKNISENSTKYFKEIYTNDKFNYSEDISESEYLEDSKYEPEYEYDYDGCDTISHISKYFSCNKNELLKIINDKNIELCLLERNNKYLEYDLNQINNYSLDDNIFSSILDRCIKLKNIDYINNLVKNNKVLFSNSFSSSIIEKLDLVFFENLLKSNGAFSSQGDVIENIIEILLHSTLTDYYENLIKTYTKYKKFNKILVFEYKQNKSLYDFLDSCKISYIKGTKIYPLFSTNYNILRIISGMAGLSYSN